MTIEQEQTIRSFQRHLIEEEKSRSTQDKYVRDVTAFFTWLGDRPLDKPAVLDYKTRIQKSYAPASVNSMLSSLNSLFDFMERHDLHVRSSLRGVVTADGFVCASNSREKRASRRPRELRGHNICNRLRNHQPGDKRQRRDPIGRNPLDGQDGAHHQVRPGRREPLVVKTSAPRSLIVRRENVAVRPGAGVDFWVVFSAFWVVFSAFWVVRQIRAVN